MSREAKASSWPLSRVGACRCRDADAGVVVASGHTKPKGSNVASGLMIFRPWPPCMIACFKLETETHVAPSVGAGNFWAPDERTCSEGSIIKGQPLPLLLSRRLQFEMWPVFYPVSCMQFLRCNPCFHQAHE